MCDAPDIRYAVSDKVLDPIHFDPIGFINNARNLTAAEVERQWEDAYEVFADVMQASLEDFEPGMPATPPVLMFGTDSKFDLAYLVAGDDGVFTITVNPWATVLATADMLNLVIVHELWHYYHRATGQTDTRSNCEEEAWASLRTLRVAGMTELLREYRRGHTSLCRIEWAASWIGRGSYAYFQQCYNKGVVLLDERWDSRPFVYHRMRNDPRLYHLHLRALRDRRRTHGTANVG